MMRMGAGDSPLLLGGSHWGGPVRGRGPSLCPQDSALNRHTSTSLQVGRQPHTRNTHAIRLFLSLSSIPYSSYTPTHTYPSLVPVSSLVQMFRWHCQTAAWTAWYSHPTKRQEMCMSLYANLWFYGELCAEIVLGQVQWFPRKSKMSPLTFFMLQLAHSPVVVTWLAWWDSKKVHF